MGENSCRGLNFLNKKVDKSVTTVAARHGPGTHFVQVLLSSVRERLCSSVRHWVLQQSNALLVDDRHCGGSERVCGNSDTRRLSGAHCFRSDSISVAVTKRTLFTSATKYDSANVYLCIFYLWEIITVTKMSVLVLP